MNTSSNKPGPFESPHKGPEKGVMAGLSDALSAVPEGIDTFRQQWLDPKAQNGFKVAAAETAPKPNKTDEQSDAEIKTALAANIYGKKDDGPSQVARAAADKKVFGLEDQQAA
jgi:hypothetical protein